MTKAKDLIHTVTAAARQLNSSGLNQGRSGNISVRVPDDSTVPVMLITATGAKFDELDADQLVTMSIDGHWQGETRPSSEWHFHAAVYRQRADANAVVHVHSPWATTLACMHRSIPQFHYMVAAAGGHDIPCVPYETFGTEALAEHVAKAVVDRDACLMANHGQLALGDSIEEALELAMEVEHLARCYGQALSAGEPVLLTDEQMAAAIERFRTYRNRSE
jgi:L-fuculose-phosphate aldolase